MYLWFSLLGLFIIISLIVGGIVACFFSEKKFSEEIFFGSFISFFITMFIIVFTFFNPKLIPNSFLIREITSNTITLESLKAKKALIEEMSGYSDEAKDKVSFNISEKISRIECEIDENEELLEEKLLQIEEQLLRNELKRREESIK